MAKKSKQLLWGVFKRLSCSFPNGRLVLIVTSGEFWDTQSLTSTRQLYNVGNLGFWFILAMQISIIWIKVKTDVILTTIELFDYIATISGKQ